VSKPRKILGVDPGLAATGYGLITCVGKKINNIDFGAIKTDSKKNYPQRLQKIYYDLEAVINKYKPTQVAMEKIFFFRNQKSLIGVTQSIGIISLCVQNNCLPLFEYSPLQVKKDLVGYGRASKKKVQQQVQKILKLPKLPTPRHASDALAIAIYCSREIN